MNRTLLFPAAFLLLSTVAVAQEAPPLEAAFAPGQTQKVTRADDTTWGPCPPSLPPGCAMAVLEGNPRTKQLFTIRIKTDQPFRMQAHTHPGAERVTVLDGTVSVGFGDALDTSEGTTFTAGDYYVNAPATAHYVWADEPVLIQITGIGPWVVEYLEEAE